MKRFRIQYSCFADGDDDIKAKNKKEAIEKFHELFEPENKLVINHIEEIKGKKNESKKNS